MSEENYATRTISTWLINNEEEYNRWTERAKELLEEHEYDKAKAVSELEDEIEKDWEEKLDETGLIEGPLFDFMHDELCSVDWSKVTESFTDELVVYVVCWNMPGCLPEMEPMRFDDFALARDAIHDHLVELGDGEDDEDEALVEVIAEVSNMSEPFTVEHDGYVYEVAKDE